MNTLSAERRAQVLRTLLEGNSVRATVRLTGVAKGTVLKLLATAGRAARVYQYDALRDLDIKRVQVDELWSFCYSKAKNVPAEHSGTFGYGDVWTFTALDPASKLVPCWHIGQRSGADATLFLQDLAGRMRNRIQLTTDGFRPYVEAVATAFGEGVDYAQLIKLFATPATEKGIDAQRRYSPPACTGTRVIPIVGDPEPQHIGTSHVERNNLTMRMQMRRFTRLTNGFSRKVENLGHAVALHFLWYNFGCLHGRHRYYTPAQAAGVTDHRWTIEEVVALLNSQRGSN